MKRFTSEYFECNGPVELTKDDICKMGYHGKHPEIEQEEFEELEDFYEEPSG